MHYLVVARRAYLTFYKIYAIILTTKKHRKMKHIVIVLGDGHLKIWNGIKDLLTPRDREYITLLNTEDVATDVAEEMVLEKLKSLNGDDASFSKTLLVLIGDNTRFWDIRLMANDTMNLDELLSGFDLGFANFDLMPEQAISKLLLDMIKLMADPEHIHTFPEKP